MALRKFWNEKFWISRLESQQDWIVSKPQGATCVAVGTALSGSYCGVQGEGSCRAIISVAQPVPRVEGQLTGQMASWPLVSLPGCCWAQGGPAFPHCAKLGTGRLPVFYSFGCVTHFTQDDRRICACKCTSRPGHQGYTHLCEAGRGWRVDSCMPPPSEHQHVGAQDGGGNRTAPDSEQGFAFGSPAS